jgi:glycosyltransferase involved in cell wall biosynthesis
MHRFYGVSSAFKTRWLRPLPVLGLGESSLGARLARGIPFAAFMGWRSNPFRPPFICYGRSQVALWAAVRARRFWGSRASCCRIAVELHNLPPSRSAWRLLEEVDAVFVISAALRDDIISAVPSLRGRIWVEHDGADVGVSPPDRATARAGLRLAEPGGPVVVYTGRANAGKGIGVLLEAAHHLGRINAQVVVVGKVYDEQFRVDAPPNVTFTGFVSPSQIPTYLAAADVLVMPTTDDLRSSAYTSPLKLFEYMAACRPIVASDLPVLREVLRDGSNALVYPSKDPAGLAAAVQRLWREPALSTALAERAWQDVQHYSWENRARRILRIISPPYLEG